MKYPTVLIAFSILLTSHSQIMYRNLEWFQTQGNVANFHRTVSAKDGNNDIVVVATKQVAYNNSDIIVTKYNRSGQALWSYQYDGQNNDNDYAVQVKLDQNDDVYVGMVNEDGGDSKFGILKLNSSGVLQFESGWSYSTNSYNICSDLDIDNSGNSYLIGGTSTNNGFSDYAIVKFDSIGSFAWEKTYDYNSLHDAATTVTYDSGNIAVSGASASTATTYDIATLTINALNGSVTNTVRTTSGIGIDGVNSMARDNNDNIYLIGYETVSSNQNLKLIKLDPNLNQLWVQSFDNGGSDEGVDVAVDGTGNIYVLGHSDTQFSGSDFVLRKYNSSGTLQWAKIHGSENKSINCIASDLTIDDNGDVVFVGTRDDGTYTSFYTAKHTPFGDSKFIENYTREEFTNVANTVVTIGDEIYVSGMSEYNSEVQNITIKYSVVRKDRDFELDGNGNPIYEKNELLVRLDQSSLNLSKFSTTDWETGSIDDFMTSSAVTEIRRAVENECTECDIQVYKIFRALTSNTTQLTSRTGKTVEVPDLWASLILEFPNGVDITLVKSQIEGLFPLVKYANLSLPIELGSVIPNDPLYYLQANLRPTSTLSNANINVEEAWELETGKRFVRVGVFDSGLAWRHVDFGNGVWGQTKMAHGWDFFDNESLQTSQILNDQTGFTQGHGTRVAGIIGAIRDNGLGIAGIAGGNNNSTFNIDSAGVSLYGLAIENEVITDDIANVMEAMVTSTFDDVLSGVDYDYGLDIQNHSWALKDNWSTFTDSNVQMLREATRLVNRAEVTLVAIRHNDGDTRTVYPALFDDDWVICVTATGDDGQFTDTINSNFISNSGGPIDIAAPGYNQFVTSTNHTNNVTDSWIGFGGTSAAAPHVTGVAALLMSYLDADPNSGTSPYNDLVPEDVEAIIQMTADDTDVIGYDSLTGFGRLNAGKALKRVRKGRYKLEHFDNIEFSSTDNSSLYSSGDTVLISELYQNQAGLWFLPGSYIVNTYKLTSEIEHNVAIPYVIDTFWSRHSGSETFPLFDSNKKLIPHEKVTIDSLDASKAYLHGYTYEVFDLNNNLLGWWPMNHNLQVLEFDYTLLLKDPNSTVGIENVASEETVSIYPNPTKDSQTIKINVENSSNIKIDLFDAAGQLVKNIFEGQRQAGNFQIEVSTSPLSEGLYVYKIEVDGRILTFKIIKD